jgi:acid phosphatase type 7
MCAGGTRDAALMFRLHSSVIVTVERMSEARTANDDEQRRELVLGRARMPMRDLKTRRFAARSLVLWCMLGACMGRDETALVTDDATVTSSTAAAPGDADASGEAVSADTAVAPAEAVISGETVIALRRATRAAVPRSGALAPFELRCGEGRVTRGGASELGRLPYVQRVTATSISILYTHASSDAGPDQVEITEPDGNPVLSVSATIDPTAPDGFQWVANVLGLKPLTYYCYAVLGLTERIGFRTAPLPDTNAVVRFAVFGDSGSASVAQTSVRDQLEVQPIDLILHTGDAAYEQGTLAQFEQNFFRIYQGLIKSVPIFPVSGNHEYRTDSASPYLQVFDLPHNGVPGSSERYYSFDWGDVHFVALNTEQVNDEQVTWLERDLAANQRRWTIVYLHRPPYSSGVHGGTPFVEQAFVPIFQRHRVPLVFTGHDHDYERTLPMDGVTYVITGGGGKSIRSVGRSAFTAYSESVMHFVWVEVNEETLRLRAIDAAGGEIDSVEISADARAGAGRASE